MSCMIRIRQLYPTLAQNDRNWPILAGTADKARHLSSQKLAEMAGAPVRRREVRTKIRV